MTDISIPRSQPVASSAALPRWSFAALTYVIATLVTGANWLGDTVDYVESIVLFSRGVDHWMWDFAHLLWRSLGWVLSTLFAPATRVFVGPDERLNVILTLNAVSWISGFVCVILIHSLALQVSGREWIANFVSIASVFTYCFFNWSRAGSAYVPGLALLLTGMLLSMRNSRSILAGIAAGAAVCLWVPYLLIVPAALMAPLILFGLTRERVHFATRCAIVAALVTAVAYLSVMAGLRLTTIEQVRAWIAWSGHGVEYSGAKRVVFGFARAFLDMGHDGLLFKRYLLKDPYNPVTLRDLAGATVVKLSVVYGFAASLIVTLMRFSRRFLVLLAVGFLPVLGLALLFGGSEPERYLPLFPIGFMALASGLSAPSRLFKAIAVAFFSVVAVTNVAAMANPVLERREEAAAERVRDLLPRLDERSLVFAATYQDELMTFNRTFPFHPVNRSSRFHLSVLVSPGTSWNTHWCEDFAARALSTWRHGGTTWVSKRALATRPLPEWSWAEGDDRRVSWSDFPRLLSHLDLGEAVGGADGFVQLLPSLHNMRYLSHLTTSALVAERQAR